MHTALHSLNTCLCPPPRTRGCPAQGRRGPCAGAPASCAAPTRGGEGAALSVCLSDPSHGLSVCLHLSAYLRPGHMSVCPSVSRSVSVCQSLTVTVMVAAVFQLEVWSGRRNSVRVCLPAHVPLAAHGCLSLSVCESVCHRHDVTSRPQRPLAPVCPRPARPPPSARPARQAGSD